MPSPRPPGERMIHRRGKARFDLRQPRGIRKSSRQQPTVRPFRRWIPLRWNYSRNRPRAAKKLRPSMRRPSFMQNEHRLKSGPMTIDVIRKNRAFGRMKLSNPGIRSKHPKTVDRAPVETPTHWLGGFARDGEPAAELDRKRPVPWSDAVTVLRCLLLQIPYRLRNRRIVMVPVMCWFFAKSRTTFLYLLSSVL